MTKPRKGALSVLSSQQHSGRNVALARILPTEQTQRNRDWHRLIAATRDAETQRLVSTQLRDLAAYAGNNVIVFPGSRP